MDESEHETAQLLLHLQNAAAQQPLHGKRPLAHSSRVLTRYWCPHHCYMGLYHSSYCMALILCSSAFLSEL